MSLSHPNLGDRIFNTVPNIFSQYPPSNIVIQHVSASASSPLRHQCWPVNMPRLATRQSNHACLLTDNRTSALSHGPKIHHCSGTDYHKSTSVAAKPATILSLKDPDRLNATMNQLAFGPDIQYYSCKLIQIPLQVLLPN